MIARTGDRGTALGVACAVAIAVVAWPIRTVEPGVGGDWSWVAALSYAFEHGLPFGREIVWSYGPLGFLDTWYGPVYFYEGALTLSWLFTALLQLLLAGSVLVALRRSFSLPVAAVAAAVVVALAFDAEPALALVWCALAILRDDDAPRGRWAAAFAPALGALVGLALLGKLNQGIELLLLALIALLARPRRRDALAFAGALLASAAVGWFATGQTLSDVWPWVRNGAEVVIGYTAAMSTSDPAHRWAYPVALALIALVLALAWDATRGVARRRRWAFLALCLVYSGFSLKEGFVREDPVHIEVFYGDMIVLFAVLPVRSWRRAVALAGIGACAVAIGGALDANAVVRKLNPYRNVAAAADQLQTLVSPSRRAAIDARVRAEVDATYRLTPQVVEAVGRHTVMLWPLLFGEIAWAHGLDLRPLPSLEPYATYTPALDRLGADMLASARAPERIMHAEAVSLDERNPTFEAPLATLQILCRYRPIATAAPWQVLARGPSRCSAPRPLRTVSAAWGERVAVPRPRSDHALVLVRVDGLEPHGLEQLKSLVMRPRARRVVLDGQPYRLVAATAADGLLLSAPGGYDFPEPFAFAPNAGEIAIRRDGGQPGGRIQYAFEEVPLTPLQGSG